MPYLRKLFAFLSSFGLATSVLTGLLILTFLGTLEQVEYGLVESQTRYFESMFLDRIDVGACWRALAFDAYFDMGNLKLPLIIVPSGYLLLAILFVNLLCGGIIRIRKKPQTIGIFISHSAILLMIAAGAVAHQYSKEGILDLTEGQTGDEFKSFHDRVVEIEKVSADPKAKRSVLVIGDHLFRDLTTAGKDGKGRTFTHSSLPFDLMLTSYAPHAQARRDKDGSRTDAIDGYFLQPLAAQDANGGTMVDEQRLAGCIAIAKDKKDGSEQRGIICEESSAGWTVKSGSDTYLINLGRRTWALPFSLRLDHTEQEKHPGTERARRFTSKVTKLTDGHEEKRVVTMNEPVRSGGYAIFQQSFDDGVTSGTKVKRSGFQVVQNPSDHWPLISCIIVGIGLLIHFSMALARAMKWNQWIAVAVVLGLVAVWFGLALLKLL